MKNRHTREPLPRSVEDAEFDAMMSGQPALTPEDMAKLEKESKEMIAYNNKRGAIKAKLGGLAASIASGGTVRH